MPNLHRLLAVLPVAIFVGVVACKGGDKDGEERLNPEPIPGQTAFESDDPSTDAGQNGGSTSDTGAAADASSAAPPDKTGDSAERAIEEADIIKVEGTRLYALSRVGGLSIIDVSTRDKLRFLGRYRPSGEPFEMYVRDNVVLAMVNGFQEWSYDSGGAYSSKQTSRVIALDVNDATKITSIGDFAVPGEVSDSRIVGDVMYVVSHQNGYCYRCETGKPATVVMSLAIKDVRAISKVDQVSFASPTASYSWWKRSVSATTNRFWIGGPEYAWTSGEKPRSTIQALDVSDPTGKLSLGATVTVDGLIQSRWQMDESAGVLRVVSQPGGWSGLDPAVETFTVTSSTVVAPLGKTYLKLPKPEALMSVRFDGTRGYAITAERTDPLFTIDLSDPAKPVQMGELEMPGWVYHMEPRGNRLIGLGFDAGNPDGAMTLSLFDVSNLATPKMIKRVNFGKGWASAPEDRDRIHKALRILDDQQLIMVPFSSSEWRGPDGCYSAQSGIQLIDWKDDTLALRGLASVHGLPRRAFLHDQRLFAVSDSQVATYDIANRDAPAPKASLPLANPSHKSVVVGDHLVQLSHDWSSQHVQLVVTPRGNVEQAIPTGSIDLAPMIGESTCGYYGWSAWWNAALYAKGNLVYVIVPSSYYGYYDGGKSTPATLVGVVDLTNPANPMLIGKGRIEGSAGYSYGGYGSYGNAILQVGQSMVFTGEAVVSVRTDYSYAGSYESGKATTPTPTHHLSVIDLRDPKNPRAGGNLTLPSSWVVHTGLNLAGGRVFTSHYEPSSAGKVRFYIDEISVSDPSKPALVAPINVPGSLLQLDPVSSRAATVDYRRTFHAADDHASCAKAAPPGDIVLFDWSTKTCVSIHRTLRQVRISGGLATMEKSLELPAHPIVSATVADTRALLRSGYGYYGYYDSMVTGERAWVLSGLREGSIAMSPEITIASGSYYGGSAWASGDRAVVQSGRRMVVVDLAAARVVRTAELNGYWTSHVAVANDNAYASLGDYGVTAIPLR